MSDTQPLDFQSEVICMYTFTGGDSADSHCYYVDLLFDMDTYQLSFVKPVLKMVGRRYFQDRPFRGLS